MFDFSALNIKLEEALQKLDLLGYSSQFYYIITINLSALMLILVGMFSMISHTYNVFADYMVIFYGLFWWPVFKAVKFVAVKLASKQGSWVGQP